MSDDASATYRGYRKQALYVLSRLLTDSDAELRVYHPEGAEDLAIYNSAQDLVEVIQVKDYTSALALSHFKPGSPEGFFARMRMRRKKYPGCVVVLASFGPLGPELKGAIEGAPNSRKIVVDKLNQADADITKAEAAALLDELKSGIVHPVETQLRASILDAFTGTIAGSGGERSLELLLFWVFDASEHRRAITRRSALLQLEKIGEYLAALRDSSSEWMSTVHPIRCLSQSPEEQARLREEYGRGVQARWDHIAAGIDCPRPLRLAEVHAKLQRYSVVIIRGASGQGKSTLGWRYLFDYSADGLRFQIRMVNGREHALRVANALRSHVLRLRLQAVVWLDLGPSDTGWLELLRELAGTGIKILVAVREEDFRRAGISIDEFDFGEIALDSISPEEAELIFSQLTGTVSTTSLNFLDAWTRFGGTGGGPLLEFTHLVTQGGTLAAKLDKQIQRLANESMTGMSGITTLHLHALALAALAHSAGCRVDASRLCVASGLEPTARPFSYLEHEYLLRVSETGAIAGLHALRSQAIIQALLRDAPLRWPELAAQCLSIVLDEDLEAFLLYAFSRHSEHRLLLRTALGQLKLRSWTQVGGIGRALLWTGVSDYVDENHSTLATIIQKHEETWIYLCDSCIGGGFAAWQELRKSFGKITRVDLPLFVLTPKDSVFVPLQQWMAKANLPTDPPSSPTDWLAVGDLAYWSGSQSLSGPIAQALAGLFPTALPAGLKLDELGELVSGLYACAPAEFSEWHDRHAAELKRLVLHQTGSLHLEDDGQLITIIFPISLSADSNDGTGEGRALALLHLVHDLFPHRTKVGTQGIGAEFLQSFLPFDLTTKEVASTHFTSTRVAGLNSLFRNLVTYRHRRLATWHDYANTVVQLRVSVGDAFRALHRGWSRMIDQSIIQPRMIAKLPGATLDQIHKLSERPMLPRMAVDEWGFVSEDNATPKATSKEGGCRLQRYATWRKSFGSYATAVNGMVQPAINETVVFAALKNVSKEQPVDSEGGRLLLSNLGDAWQALMPMQREFRHHFEPLASPGRLEELERNERASFRHLWAVSFWMVREPRRIGAAAREGEQVIARQQADFTTALQAEVASALASPDLLGVRLSYCTDDDQQCLVVICDHATMANFASANARLVPALWRAAHAQAWRPFEWMPLVVAWPKWLVVHLFRGSALTPSGVKHTSLTVFLREQVTDAAPHELVALPVSAAALAEAGVTCNPSPLLAACIAWHGAMLVFSVSLMRVSALVSVLGKHEVSPESLDGVLTRISRETSEGLNVARKAKEALTDLLNPMALAPATGHRAADWLAQVDDLSAAFLLSTEEDTQINVDLAGYLSWLEGNAARMASIDSLMTEIVETYA